ncbi:MAG: hypothetical protein QME74_04890 [Candidatus Edwardsbacteria bacterium]|nr:hypothetical protein [Candidatus Edwardsbacteria bacterium]
MNREELKHLQSLREYPSVSILMPTYRSIPDNRQDPIRMKNLLKQAVGRLRQEYESKEIAEIVRQMETAAAGIDYQHTLDGLALYASASYSAVHYLPFPLQERVVIDHTFATRPLVVALNRSPRYLVLALSENSTRLFDAVRDTLAEVMENGFPVAYEGAGSTEPVPKSQEIEKSRYMEARHHQFFRLVGQQLSTIYGDERLPLVLAGVDRHQALYREANGQPESIIPGNHDNTPARELGKLTWPAVRGALHQKRHDLIGELASAIGTGKYAAGINPIWTLAKEGRVAILLAEEGFIYPARLDGSGKPVPADDPAAPGVIDDAVDELAELVLAKRGEVYFTDPGSLAQHQRIGAILRY